MNPMSFAYSRKHWRQMFSPYFLMRPHWLEQTRLQTTQTGEQLAVWKVLTVGGYTRTALQDINKVEVQHRMESQLQH